MKKSMAVIFVLSSLLALAFAAQPSMDMAPAFVLQDLDGNEVSSSVFAGKVLLLNFWATWCPPCQAEIPGLKSLQADYKDRGFAVVGISVDEEGPEAVKAFVQRKGINYPVLMSTEEVIDAYGGIRGIPTTFLINREGKIVRRYFGEQRKSSLEAAIQPLL